MTNSSPSLFVEPFPSGSTLGIAGGGQLARMMAQSALQLGCQIAILERQADCPAATLAKHRLVGDWNQLDDLKRLAEVSDIVILENEFVDADAIAALEAAGVCVRPGSFTLRLVQDKLIQKGVLADAGLTVPPFQAAANIEEATAAGESFGWPVVLKKRRNGYDGKGNRTVASALEMPDAWRELDGGKSELFVEAFCAFTDELAVMVTRGVDGATIAYPVVHTVQRNHVCEEVRAPAPVSAALAGQAIQLALRAAETVGMIGSMGVEMFLTADGQLLINELAPRVHNTGHYTIEACDCSQFENHVRAVLGWPLGSPRMRQPAAIMINLLGKVHASGFPSGLDQALAVPGAHVHLYGKTLSAPGRKLGHVTALGATLEQAFQTAQTSAQHLQFTTPL